jgi:hypothetical protein
MKGCAGIQSEQYLLLMPRAETGPVAPIERYLAYLTDIERSPNNVKAYTQDLKDWFVFLAGRGLGWPRRAVGGCGS